MPKDKTMGGIADGTVLALIEGESGREEATMKRKHARDIPDFSRSAPPAAKHGSPQPARELAPARQLQQRQVVKPKVVAKPGRRGQ